MLDVDAGVGTEAPVDCNLDFLGILKLSSLSSLVAAMLVFTMSVVTLLIVNLLDVTLLVTTMLVR